MRPVTDANWRDVIALDVNEEQRAFVAEPGYYLALCAYGTSGWQPLAIELGGKPIGFLMWAIDPEAVAGWLGGFFIDARYQRQGYGREALELIVRTLRERGLRRFALSYQPENHAARDLYFSFGFRETGETEGDELVARLDFS